MNSLKVEVADGVALLTFDIPGETANTLRASFQAGASAIMAHPQIYQWGLHGRLLDIAENYLGVPVGYDGLNIFFTKADGRENGPR